MSETTSIYLSLLPWLVETSPVSSDFRGLTWKMWLLICSETLETRCERSVVKTRFELYRYVCGDIWHFVCHFQCWTCFGGMKYFRSQGSQSNILSPEMKFLVFTVLFTSNRLNTTTANTFVMNSDVLQYIHMLLCTMLDHGSIPVVWQAIVITPTWTLWVLHFSLQSLTVSDFTCTFLTTGFTQF